MDDMDQQLRRSLQRITERGPVDHGQVWQALLARRHGRRQRRVARAAVAGVVLVGIVAVGIFGLQLGGDEDSHVVASNGSFAEHGSGVSNQEADTDLLGRTFTGSDLETNGEPRPLVADTIISISFLVDPSGTPHITWNAGCNGGGAQLIEAGAMLQLDGVGSTLMRCLSEQLAEQDQWLWEFLTSQPSWTLDGDTLILSSGETVLRLTASE